MDYLQQATERARRKREGKLGQTPEPGVIENVDEALPCGPTGASPGPDAAEAAPRGSDESATYPTGVRKGEDNVSHDRPKQVERAEPLRDLPSPAEVRYTRTRKVEPSDDLLLTNRVIAGEVHDPRVEVYRQLRSQVLDTMRRNQWSTLAITSAHENAGKTLTSLNLAVAISQDVNQTVLLVDLDLRKPDVHSTLGIEIEVGIVDHLQGKTRLEDVLINPGFPRLVVLPGRPQGRHASEILTSPEMKAFMSEITSRRYPDRLIIFDLPPLLRNDDAMAFVPSVDCCLLVAEAGVTTPEQLERSQKLLKHARLLGTVLNKARHGTAV